MARRVLPVAALAALIVAAISYRVLAPTEPAPPGASAPAPPRGEAPGLVPSDPARRQEKPDGVPDAPADALADQIDALARSSSGRRQRDAATLRCRLDYSRHSGSDTEARLAALGEALAKVRSGEPLPPESSSHIRGYYSPNDDSCQPFSLALPEGYDAGSRYPLLVFLHHHGWTEWYRPFQGHPAPCVPGFIVAAPHGRGSCDYMWIAEDDVLAVMDAVIADFGVDAARVYVTGWSMGGTGSWNMPCRYPDRFAAGYPVAGNADFTAWLEAWKEDRKQIESPYSETRWWLRWNTAPVTFAENLVNVWMTCNHGRLDTINPVGHSRRMDGRLQQLGYPNVRYDEGEGGHGWGATLDERVRWMQQHRIDPWPKRVRYKTAFYRWDGAYWVRIDRFERRMKFAEIDATVREPGRIEVKTENLRRFTLKLSEKNAPAQSPLSVAVDGPALRVDAPLPASVSFEKAGEPPAWTVAREPEKRSAFPPSKRKGLEGPCDDLLRDPFLVVVGTTAEDPFERQVIREEAQRWRRQWFRRFVCWPPVKDDSQVTDADIRAKNLILFGGPHANSVCRRAMDRLPVRMEGKAVIAGAERHEGDDVGMKACYPNPLCPDRMVYIQAATTWKGMWQMTHRFGNWFDWMPLDNRDWFDYCVFDDRSEEFETFLTVGFFDDRWALDDSTRWRALPDWRAKVTPRKYPQHRQVHDAAASVCLSDVLPAQIDTAKGPLRFDRSFHGGQLRLGRNVIEKGLGQWIESDIRYDLGGKFRRFTAKVAIDSEGQEKISSARAEVEYTVFTVLADDKVVAQSPGRWFDDAPYDIDADIAGARTLTLRVRRTRPQGWLYGPIAWGEPTVRR